MQEIKLLTEFYAVKTNQIVRGHSNCFEILAQRNKLQNKFFSAALSTLQTIFQGYADQKPHKSLTSKSNTRIEWYSTEFVKKANTISTLQ